MADTSNYEVIALKKGKVFGKSQIVLGLLVVTLGLAVFLNMKYSSNSISSNTNNDKNLGEALYVNQEQDNTVQTSTNQSYISIAKNERNSTRNTKIEEIKSTIENSETDEALKNNALSELENITKKIEVEINIETIVKSKGFNDALAILSDESLTLIVQKEGELLTSETLQLQDAATSQSKLELEKIKIITVK